MERRKKNTSFFQKEKGAAQKQQDAEDPVCQAWKVLETFQAFCGAEKIEEPGTASHSKESRQIEKAGLFAFAELFEDGPIPEKDVGFSCKSNSRVGKILIGQHGGHVAFIKFHACIGFLDCFVSKIIGITFALDAIFFPMFPGQNINALIAAAPGDFYMVKAVSAEQSGTVVLKGMTVHSVVRFLHCNDSSPVRILSFSR